MTRKEQYDLIEKRRKEDPEFNRKYIDYMAQHNVDPEMSDEELENISGGFIGQMRCPRCKEYSFVTWCFGVYWYCEKCDYTEWFA